MNAALARKISNVIGATTQIDGEKITRVNY